MSGTTVLAIYAAVIASCGLGWQVYTWQRAHSTILSIKVTNAFLTPGGEHVVMINAVNQSGHAVRTTSAGFVLQDGSKRDFVFFGPCLGSTIPGIVEPRDSANIWLEVSEATQQGIDLYRPLVAWVNTADDRRFHSKPTTLMCHD